MSNRRISKELSPRIWAHDKQKYWNHKNVYVDNFSNKTFIFPRILEPDKQNNNNLEPFGEEELLEDGDEGRGGEHVLPLYDPVPLVQPLTKRIDHLKWI